MNIDTLIKLSDALDKRGHIKFSDRVDRMIEKIAASPMSLIRQRDILQRKRRFHERKLDALRRRGGKEYDKHHFWMGELITDLAAQEDKIDEQLQQLAEQERQNLTNMYAKKGKELPDKARARFDDLEKFVRYQRVKSRMLGGGCPRRPRRVEQPIAQMPLVPIKKTVPGGFGKPMPDWMRKIMEEREGSDEPFVSRVQRKGL